MIISFRSKALERFWWRGDPRRIDSRHVEKIRRQLGTLDAATTPEGMNLPGWRFHRLKGAEAGRYAVWVDANFRMTFAWSEQGPDAVDVDYEDYH
ncbi:MAG: type II toxin-antitoxin system RelE/ParE family toxin [Hyphomicrobium sp.]